MFGVAKYRELHSCKGQSLHFPKSSDVKVIVVLIDGTIAETILVKKNTVRTLNHRGDILAAPFALIDVELIEAALLVLYGTC